MKAKQSTSGNYIRVGIANSSGVGVTGLAFSAPVIKIVKPGFAAVTKSLSAPDWVEAGQGWYWLRLSAGDCDTLGQNMVLTSYLAVEGEYDFDIAANLESDIFERLGAPVVTVSADIATVKLKTDGLPSDPADESIVLAAIAAIPAPDNTSIAAIKLKTDTLPSDPADQSLIIAATDALSTDIATMQSDIDDLTTNMAAVINAVAVLHGLMGANNYEDTFVYNGPDGALSSSRLRTYDSAVNQAAHGVAGLLKTYTFTFGYTGSLLTSVGIVAV
jgi:hypothetical protein